MIKRKEKVMSIFSLFRKRSDNTRKLLCDSMAMWMSMFLQETDEVADGTAYIFAQSMKTANDITDREIKKTLLKFKISPTIASLNIIQNCAMVNITPCPMEDLILGKDKDSAYKLYVWANEKKLERNYISQKQYEENEQLGMKIKLDTLNLMGR